MLLVTLVVGAGDNPCPTLNLGCVMVEPARCDNGIAEACGVLSLCLAKRTSKSLSVEESTPVMQGCGQFSAW